MQLVCLCNHIGRSSIENIVKKYCVNRGAELYVVLQLMMRRGNDSSLGRYVFGSEISYNKAPPRLPGLGC
jgi:hypothetical protein